jgi:prepilin peptidase CpaA
MAFGILMAGAALSDVAYRKVPNALCGLLPVLFVLQAGLHGMPWFALLVHMACGAVVLTAGFALFSAGVFGGGDAKLLAAASAWFGFETLVPFLLATALAGGVLALIWLMYPGRGRTVPYAAAIAAGALACAGTLAG